MATQRDYYELYRRSSIGVAMMQTLDEMVNEQLIEPQLAFIVMNAFDKAASEVLAEKVKAKMTFKGHLDVYRFCDEVWTFMIKDVTFTLDNKSSAVSAERIKIVSCNAKKPGEV